MHIKEKLRNLAGAGITPNCKIVLIDHKSLEHQPQSDKTTLKYA